ncbi:MAG: alpha/beta fold hydrolase [Patescibacteria group bacterium]
MPNRITFVTSDGVTISGSWQSPGEGMAVLLVHMMPETKESWVGMQSALAERGIASLAIDLRGHGESTSKDGVVLDYKTFSDAEHQASINDLEAALGWLASNGVAKKRIGACGASIGANLALRLLTQEPEVPFAVLLSPGADYHGTNAVADAERILPQQAVCVVSSENDLESFEASQRLFATAKSKIKDAINFKNAGHATRMFMAEAGLVARLAEWMAKRLKQL